METVRFNGKYTDRYAYNRTVVIGRRCRNGSAKYVYRVKGYKNWSKPASKDEVERKLRKRGTPVRIYARK